MLVAKGMKLGDAGDLSLSAAATLLLLLFRLSGEGWGALLAAAAGVGGVAALGTDEVSELAGPPGNDAAAGLADCALVEFGLRCFVGVYGAAVCDRILVGDPVPVVGTGSSAALVGVRGVDV